MGGKISREVARKKHDRYKDYMSQIGQHQTEFIIFSRDKLQEWIDQLPAECTQVLVYLGLESGELDVFFWPYNSLNQPIGAEMADEGYNIGNRQPKVPYGKL